MLRGTIFPFELLSKDRATAGTLKVSKRMPLKLETRIYDISDLVAGPAGSKEQSLEANFLAQRIKADIDPQSWYQADGEGTCTVYHGRKLAVLQLRENHAKIDFYLKAMRQYGDSSEKSLLPEGWELEFKTWDESPEPNGTDSFLGIKRAETGRLSGEECLLKVTTFSGEPMVTIHKRDFSDKLLALPNAKYLVFYEYGIQRPVYMRMRSGPFLLNLSKSGRYLWTPNARLGSGVIAGTHKGTYAVNFESAGQFPVITGNVYQPSPGEYQIGGLASGHYLLNSVTQHGGDNVFVRRAQIQVGTGESVRVDLPALEIGNCTISGVMHGKPSSGQEWAVLIRQSNARLVTTCNVYESLTIDTDYVIRGRNIIQISDDQAQFKATGLLPGKYTVTAIERRRLQGFEVQRQQSKPLIIKDGESVTLDFDL
ncbi:MAG: carboxypeptidase regulatory-like domain-containing protein [Phycisphaeraceae bacterium]|nr:carboxypeptidase regulatory-like domain-containing protein [Phycisphaeraceae bacterium]